MSDTGNIRLRTSSRISNFDGIILKNPYENKPATGYKVQLHCHTTNSDGDHSPVDLMDHYKADGYDAVAITDHEYLTPDPEVAGIIHIPSQERSVWPHITIYDISSLTANISAQDIVDEFKAADKLCSAAHTAWPNTFVPDQFVKEIDYFPLMEIYNYATAADCSEKVDVALSNGHFTHLIATDDCHSPGGVDYNGAWVIVHSTEKTKASILAALKSGCFYASSGNDISVSLTNNVVTAVSVASSNFRFIGKKGTVLKSENGVTTSSYTIIGDEKYVRIESSLTATPTLKAWSNPIWIFNPQFPHIKEPSNPIDFIDNGSFRFWQRGITKTLTITNAHFFLADRFMNQITGPSDFHTLTVTREEFSIGQSVVPNDPYYFMRVDLTFGADATDSHVLKTLLPGISRFSGKVFHISFWARAESARSAALYVRTQYGSGGSAYNYFDGETISLTTTWQKFEHTISVPSIYGKTVVLNSNNGLTIGLLAYKNGDTTFPLPSGVVGETTHGYIDVAEFHMFEGTTEGDCTFNYDDQLRRCQKFCWKTFPIDTAPATATGSYVGAITMFGVVAGTAWNGILIKYPVSMFKAPVPSFYNPISDNSKWYNRGRAGDSGITTNAYNEYGIESSMLHIEQVAEDGVNQTYYVHALFDAE